MLRECSLGCKFELNLHQQLIRIVNVMYYTVCITYTSTVHFHIKMVCIFHGKHQARKYLWEPCINAV